jgi:hypothetical protein
MTAAAGTCFGFRVESTLPFRYLRSGDGEPLSVAEWEGPPEGRSGQLLVEWKTPFRARLYEHDAAYRLWISRSGWFGVDPGAGRIGVPSGDEVRREERLWGLPALLCFLARGDIPLHAAAVEVDGGAVLLAAPGTFGKTTLAAGFARAGHRLLNEDLTCLRAARQPSVVPGPAMLRLREDVAHRLQIPGAIPVGANGDRVHLALGNGHRGDSAPVPVRAIVLLEPSGKDAAPALSPVDPVEAIRDLFALSFRLPRDADRMRAFAGVADLVGAVPAWRLSYAHDLERLDEAVEAVVARV